MKGTLKMSAVILEKKLPKTEDVRELIADALAPQVWKDHLERPPGKRPDEVLGQA